MSRVPSKSRADLLADVAEMYYVEGLDQRAIAERVGLSRSNISRLLAEARNRGIVDIRIRRPLARATPVEAELTGRFPLEEARVLGARPGHSTGAANAEVGGLAAGAFLERVRAGQRVGISWGTALEWLIGAMEPQTSLDVEVVQLLGGVTSVSEALPSGERLGPRLAEALGGRFTPLLAPATITSTALAEDLLRQPGVGDVIERGRSADVALIGLGAYDSGSSGTLFESLRLTPSERKAIASAGAIGEINARMFDIEGRICPLPMDQRIASIDLESLRRIPLKIAIARGIFKRDAILGALRGRFVDVLVTDEATALAVLEADSAG